MWGEVYADWENVPGRGTYKQKTVYGSGRPSQWAIDRDNEMATLTKAANLLNFNGKIKDTYGSYWAGCGSCEKNGFSLVFVNQIYKRKMGYRTISFDPITPVFATLEELVEYMRSKAPSLFEEDWSDEDGNPYCSEIGQKIMDYIQTLKEPNAVCEALKCLHPKLEADWEVWWETLHN